MVYKHNDKQYEWTYTNSQTYFCYLIPSIPKTSKMSECTDLDSNLTIYNMNEIL